MSSSSAAIIDMPTDVPCPSSVRPVLIETVLSACTAIHVSTCAGSYGPLLANGLSAAAALPVSAPVPIATTSAPVPCRNDLRESSRVSVAPVPISSLLHGWVRSDGRALPSPSGGSTIDPLPRGRYRSGEVRRLAGEEIRHASGPDPHLTSRT